MSSQHVVETLVSKIRLDAGDYLDNAEKVDKSSDGMADTVERTEKRVTKANKNTGESSQELAKSIRQVTAALAALWATAKSSRALSDLAGQAARFNNQLEFMQNRLGTVSAEIRRMSVAGEALGGTGAGMLSTMQSLNQGIQEMVLMGDSSLIPFMSALNVGLVDMNGNARESRDVILDMAAALSSMDPRKAYAIASSMGIDESTINAMMQGRDAMQEMLDIQDDIYVSNASQLQASRDLIRAQALLESRWLSLKTVIGNAVTPALTRLTEWAEGFVNYLVRNEHVVTGVVIAISGVITAVLIPAIQRLYFIVLPFIGKAAIILGVAAAFIALYDDYKTWAEGGESLFDWEKFSNYINKANLSVDNLKKAFLGLFGEYESWSDARKEFSQWLEEIGATNNGELSIRGLASAFVTLAGDIIRSTGVLEDFLQIIALVKDGEYAQAGRVAANVAVKAARGAYDLTSSVAESGARFIDTSMGHDPDAGEGVLTSGVRSMSSWGRSHFDRASDALVGDIEPRERRSISDGERNEHQTPPRQEIRIAIDPNVESLLDRVRFMGGSAPVQSSIGESRPVTPLMDHRQYASSSSIEYANHRNASENNRTNRMDVNISSLQVNTSANTVGGATVAGVKKVMEESDMLNQIGSGL